MDQEVRKLPEEASRGSLGSYGRRAHAGGGGTRPPAPAPFKVSHPGAKQMKLEKFTMPRDILLNKGIG